MTYESGICFHCGKLKGEHDNEVISFDAPMCPYSNHQTFEDSGLKRVRDNAEEVLRAAQEFKGFVHSERCEVKAWAAVEYLDKLKALEAAISRSIEPTTEAPE